MLRSRIIPFLLVQDSGLVKTVKFREPKYVGDPINAVKIFNEKEVDELVVLDIDASTHGREPDYKLIKNLAVECRMPFCYGGGIRSAEQAARIISLGVEKIALSSGAIERPELIQEISAMVGSQSVAVVLDIKKHGILQKYTMFTHNGKNKVKPEPIEFAKRAEALGAGEIIVNSISNDGTMKGYDFELARRIRDVVTVPISIVGGAGSVDDFSNLINENGVIGAGAGSFFVFKGQYRAVLISYTRP